MVKKIVLLAFLLIPLGVMAQEKIAYFTSVEVVSAMPEYTQLQDSIEKTQLAIKMELTSMEDEYNKKYQAFMKEAETLIESIRIRRMQEIQDLEQRAATYSEQSKAQLQQLYESMLNPIQQKVRDAIQKVGAENGFTYILDGAGLLYVSPSATNATDLVKKKLGLK
jgi:outer membrane protein